MEIRVEVGVLTCEIISVTTARKKVFSYTLKLSTIEGFVMYIFIS